jgi:hypothetical protein
MALSAVEAATPVVAGTAGAIGSGMGAAGSALGAGAGMAGSALGAGASAIPGILGGAADLAGGAAGMAGNAIGAGADATGKFLMGVPEHAMAAGSTGPVNPGVEGMISKMAPTAGRAAFDMGVNTISKKNNIKPLNTMDPSYRKQFLDSVYASLLPTQGVKG